MDEFARIQTYFAPLAGPEGLGLLDDAAVFEAPAGREIVTTKDMLVEGIHVPKGAAPGLFARRALRTNLSDLAAMAARPLGYLLGLALPADLENAWLASFAGALAEDQKKFDIALWGGDSVRTQGPVIVSITAIGSVLESCALKRFGAQAGDVLYVSGSIGQAAAGLGIVTGAVASHSESDSASQGALWRRAYEAPEPRLRLGQCLSGVASACADVSDGLLADAGHIAKASGLVACINLPQVPVDDGLPFDALAAASAGDDYELVFAAPPSKQEAIFTLSESLGLKLTPIGYLKERQTQPDGPWIEVYDRHGALLKIDKAGWRHSE